MTSVRSKDLAATAITALVVLTFFATHEGWNVPLVGDSHRWAAGVIFALGAVTCGLGGAGQGIGSRLLSFLGVVALVLAALALATGSLTWLSLLVLDTVLLWGAATVGHLQRGHRTAVPM